MNRVFPTGKFYLGLPSDPLTPGTPRVFLLAFRFCGSGQNRGVLRLPVLNKVPRDTDRVGRGLAVLLKSITTKPATPDSVSINGKLVYMAFAHFTAGSLEFFLSGEKHVPTKPEEI